MNSWWKDVMNMEFRKILAYRSDFWITFLGQMLIQLIVTISLWQSVFESNQVTMMQGLTLEMMALYYLVANIGMRILWGENIGFISREIYEGTFTRYLLYPLSFFQYKTISYISYSLFYSIQLFIFYWLYQMFFVSDPASFQKLYDLILGIFIFLLSSLLFLNMAFMVELISLWADNVWTLMIMLRFFVTFFGGGFIPLNFLPLWAQEWLSWTPFPYLINLPVKTVLGLSTQAEIFKGVAFILGWTCFFALVVQLIWMRGQKRYTGVGI
jgi:ABC-2 type transport system permease protein